MIVWPRRIPLRYALIAREPTQSCGCPSAAIDVRRVSSVGISSVTDSGRFSRAEIFAFRQRSVTSASTASDLMLQSLNVQAIAGAYRHSREGLDDRRIAGDQAEDEVLRAEPLPAGVVDRDLAAD